MPGRGEGARSEDWDDEPSRRIAMLAGRVASGAAGWRCGRFQAEAQVQPMREGGEHRDVHPGAP